MSRRIADLQEKFYAGKIAITGEDESHYIVCIEPIDGGISGPGLSILVKCADRLISAGLVLRPEKRVGFRYDFPSNSLRIGSSGHRDHR